MLPAWNRCHKRYDAVQQKLVYHKYEHLTATPCIDLHVDDNPTTRVEYWYSRETAHIIELAVDIKSVYILAHRNLPEYIQLP